MQFPPVILHIAGKIMQLHNYVSIYNYINYIDIDIHNYVRDSLIQPSLHDIQLTKAYKAKMSKNQYLLSINDSVTYIVHADQHRSAS